MKQFHGNIAKLKTLLAIAFMSCMPMIAAAANDGASESPYSILGTVLFVAWLGVVTIGGFAGWRQSITVFRNYDDLALVFFIGLDVAIAFFLVWGFGQGSQSFAIAIIVIATVTFLWLLILVVSRTWADNPSIVWFCIAIVTKISFAVLFLLNLAELINPSGKTQLQRSQNRGSALGWLLIITPIIYRLVRDKEGVWAPKDVLNRYQRGKLGL